MIGFLIILFTIIPLVELALLIKIGQIFGVINTLGIVVLTGILGAVLVKLEGLSILKRINQELYEGKIPQDSLLDGFFILCAGFLLITPGVITDILGILFLIPFTRKLFKYLIKQKIKRSISSGKFLYFSYFKKY